MPYRQLRLEGHGRLAGPSGLDRGGNVVLELLLPEDCSYVLATVRCPCGTLIANAGGV